jgi:hypothetical protein
MFTLTRSIYNLSLLPLPVGLRLRMMGLRVLYRLNIIK